VTGRVGKPAGWSTWWYSYEPRHMRRESPAATAEAGARFPVRDKLGAADE
jgi:hypothetical protein